MVEIIPCDFLICGWVQRDSKDFIHSTPKQTPNFCLISPWFSLGYFPCIHSPPPGYFWNFSLMKEILDFLYYQNVWNCGINVEVGLDMEFLTQSLYKRRVYIKTFYLVFLKLTRKGLKGTTTGYSYKNTFSQLSKIVIYTKLVRCYCIQIFSH